MSRITIDSALAEQLHKASESVELCDPSGKVLGSFIPVFDASKWEILGPELSEEELDRRANSNEKHYTTEEVLDYLRKL
jgi:hypothetical protein